jgi:hypothetical protein
VPNLNKRKSRILIFAAFGAVLLAGFQNCSKVAFSTAPSNAAAGVGTTGGSPTGGNPGSGGGGGTTSTIQQFQPALVSRDISCLACHANIQANVITDFGSGDSWYMNDFQGPESFAGGHYMANTWQTLYHVNGQVIVPNITVPNSFVTAQMPSGASLPAGPVSLASFLMQTNMIDLGQQQGWFSYFNLPVPTNTSYTNSVTPPSGQPAVISESNIYIGAPTSAEILAIVSNSNPAPWAQAKGSSVPSVSGLSISSNGTYVYTSGTVQCAGEDIVVRGTLLINNGAFAAGSGGCRLYVTGSVFIEGPITYTDNDPTDNLQITSSTSIIMGVGLNGQALNGEGTPDTTGGSTPLAVRLFDIRGNMVLRGAPTASAYTTYANSIIAEANNIGATLLQDASVPGNLPTQPSAAGQARASINFQHVLLNAPMIHSRYMGTISGVIVAESVMSSLGEFSFNFDPIFENPNIPIFPALPYDIMCTSSTSCTPANL